MSTLAAHRHGILNIRDPNRQITLLFSLLGLTLSLAALISNPDIFVALGTG
jgi:hypothetical protein